MNPRISLCMISNDGAENMAQCLASIRGHIDEIVIADTGMSDEARAVCVQHGASIHRFDRQSHPEAFFHDSAEECGQFGAPPPFSGKWALGDFAAARNESFKHATGDFLVWMDADDVLEKPEQLREVVADMVQNDHKMAFLPYHYAIDHLGRVHYRQWRERVLRKGIAQWLNPVHEVLMPLVPIGAMPRHEHPLYLHRRKPDRPGIDNRNYKILLRQVWKLKTENPATPLDPRILFYLGQEARFIEPHKAVGFYEEYLQGSGWPEERAAAHIAMGTMLEFGVLSSPQLSPQQALAHAEREYATAAVEMPNNPDGVFGLARVAYLRKRWQDCVRYTEIGFQIGNTDTMLGTNPQDRLYRPHIYLNYALGQLGRVEEALASCKAALAAVPDDPGIHGGAPGMLKVNVEAYEKELARRADAARAAEAAKAQPAAPGEKQTWYDVNEDLETPPSPSVKPDVVMIWGIQLWKQIVASGDGERARRFLEAMPSSVTSHPVLERMFVVTARKFPTVTRAQIPPSLVKGLDKFVAKIESGQPLSKDDLRIKVEKPGLDIVFWLGAGPEPWTPNTPNEKGLGGSETAAIEMAKELGRLGHRCVVYAEAMGTFDGVEYRHHTTWRGGKCDVFISSRVPAVVDHAPIDARLRLLWVHDISCGPANAQMERWLIKFDRVLCLSNWHKGFFLKCYPTLHPDQVVVTRNGIDPARFAGAPMPPKTNSMVFSSSPNRGLQWLAPNFPHIRARVPDAELHIFYGFDTWETMARMRGDHNELIAIEQFKSMLPPLGQSRDGIFNHGKRPQKELAAAYMRAKVWPYLTGFTETSCITAMEAMAAGCVPVCSALAALPETVKHGFLITNRGDDANPNFDPHAWADKVIELLQSDAAREPVARAAREYALNNLSWASLAGDWTEMFGKLMAEVDSSPIPMWRSA